MNDGSIEIREDGVCYVSGDMDMRTVPELLRSSAGLFNGRTDIVVDMSGVRRADSAGVALLVEWLRQAREREAALTLRNVPAQMWAIIKISDLESCLPIRDRDSVTPDGPPQGAINRE